MNCLIDLKIKIINLTAVKHLFTAIFDPYRTVEDLESEKTVRPLTFDNIYGP